MVLCSIEEAWGTDFNTKNKNKLKHNKTYKKNMPPHPQFSRDTTPLRNHNGKNRIPLVQNMNNKQQMQEQQNYYDGEEDYHSYYGEEEENNFNNYSEAESEDNKYENDTIDDMETNDDDNNKEEYYDYDGNVANDNNYSEYNEEEYDDTYEDDDYEEETQDQQYSNTSNAQTQDLGYDSYRGGQSNGEAHVTVNISHLMDKVNKLVNYFDKYYKKQRTGTENQDVFLFIVIGIFIIFIMDLIFRIAVKVSQKTIRE